MTVLITDSVDDQCIRLLREEGFTVEYSPGVTNNLLREAISRAEALIVRSQTKVTGEVIEAGRNLKVIGRAGAGVDNIDVDAATRRGVIVMNTPGGNTISTAEHTMSMLLALSRNIPQAHASMREGRWDRKSFVGTELEGKTIGILGLGKVGSEVAKRCAAFGMHVVAYDPVQTTESARKIGVELVELEALFGLCDYLSIHTPLTQETTNLIDERAIERCKRGVRIINCARGGIVDEKALLAALERGQVAGAALDVFEQEPPTTSALIKHPRVIVTPHLGASTEEAQEKVSLQIARQVADALHGRGIVGSVNADIIQWALRVEIRPFLQLGELLGKLIGQLKDGPLKTITISAYGSALHDSLPALGAAVLKGLFESMMEEPVNYINSPMIARERSIAVNLHQADEHELYARAVGVRCQTDRQDRACSGTVFGNRELRIIGIDGFHFEMKPQGYFVLYYNIDRPGMLAAVSAVLAGAGINIAGLALGRFGPGTKALTIVSVDTLVPAPVLDRISAIDGVSDVKLVSL